MNDEIFTFLYKVNIEFEYGSIILYFTILHYSR